MCIYGVLISTIPKKSKHCTCTRIYINTQHSKKRKDSMQYGILKCFIWPRNLATE